MADEVSAPAAGPVGAWLEAVKERANWTRSIEGIAVTTGGARASAEDVPVLVAALEAVLKQTREWAAVWPPDGHWEPADSVRAEAGQTVIEVIEAALTGAQRGEG